MGKCENKSTMCSRRQNMLIRQPQGPVSGGKQHRGCNEVEHGRVTRNTPLQQSYCTNTADNSRLESQRLGRHVHTGERKSF